MPDASTITRESIVFIYQKAADMNSDIEAHRLAVSDRIYELLTLDSRTLFSKFFGRGYDVRHYNKNPYNSTKFYCWGSVF